MQRLFFYLARFLVFHAYLRRKQNNEPLELWVRFSRLYFCFESKCLVPGASCVSKNPSSKKPYFPPDRRSGFTAADWPLSSLSYQGSPSFLCCWGRWCIGVCVWVCMSLPDLDLIPFKTLLKTSTWDWFMFASTAAPEPKKRQSRQAEAINHQLKSLMGF